MQFLTLRDLYESEESLKGVPECGEVPSVTSLSHSTWSYLAKISSVFAVLVLVMAMLAPTPAGATASDEASFIARVNQTRAAKGLPALQADSQLRNLARGWSTSMQNGVCGSGNFICHASPISAGVTHDWAKLGENVGTGPDIASVMDAFIASPGHYANIVDPEFTHIGVGVVWDGGRMYTTHRFMKLSTPAPTTTAAPPPTTTTAAPTTTTTAAPTTTTAAPTTTTTAAPTTTTAATSQSGTVNLPQASPASPSSTPPTTNQSSQTPNNSSSGNSSSSSNSGTANSSGNSSTTESGTTSQFAASEVDSDSAPLAAPESLAHVSQPVDLLEERAGVLLDAFTSVG